MTKKKIFYEVMLQNFTFTLSHSMTECEDHDNDLKCNLFYLVIFLGCDACNYTCCTQFGYIVLLCKCAVNVCRYADCKLKEEEQRAQRYLETRKGCTSVGAVSISQSM